LIDLQWLHQAKKKIVQKRKKKEERKNGNNLFLVISLWPDMFFCVSVRHILYILGIKKKLTDLQAGTSTKEAQRPSDQFTNHTCNYKGDKIKLF